MTDTAMPFDEQTVEPKPASTSTLHADLVGQIRKLVIEGDLEPGAKVPERILCERFGVSRTPLREALKTLASEGLLELLPRRGARVARLSEDGVEPPLPPTAQSGPKMPSFKSELRSSEDSSFSMSGLSPDSVMGNAGGVDGLLK